MAGTPRSLRISFDFQVPADLTVNIRYVAIEKALDTITERVIGLSEGLFPWAKSVTVRRQWVYNWTDKTEEIELPDNEKNTP